MQRTKMIFTIGPASDSKSILRQLMEIGMNVTRLNFSHGT
ncbi:pyruvate kinase, partial [Clostridium sp.]